ncbi:MAG TPA: glycogen debranching N-terminal domain-containing protein [Terriglobales bacterium]|nr:glycogen debranching N-terminal domain-containing protein [Terriglobales bacterium]
MTKADESLVQLQPRHDVVHISRGRTILATSREGAIDQTNGAHGLYVYETRMLSRYSWLIENQLPQLANASPVGQHSWLGYFIHKPPNWRGTPTRDTNPLQQTIEMRISRMVGEGLHEDVEISNHTQIATSVRIALKVDASFESRREVGGKRRQRGKLRRRWKELDGDQAKLIYEYRAKHRYKHQDDEGTVEIDRGITLTLRSESPAKYRSAQIFFAVNLPPHGTWHACLRWQAHVDGNQLPLTANCDDLNGCSDEWSKRQLAFMRDAAEFGIPHDDDLSALVHRVLSRAKSDLAGLRLFDLDKGEHNWKLAAGVPTYLALFGRDTLAAAWQASLLSQNMTQGALSILAKTQAVERNDWRDAQPGRMLHEGHTDPVSSLNFTPESLYYGAVTTSLLYPISVAELWHWTGDRDRVRPFVEPALKALAWADRYSRDKNGFYKYKTCSEQGMKNQGWKDSSDAIVYEDGSQVADPIGTCEMQAFVYAAKLHFAEVLWWFGRMQEAERLYHDSQELKKRFHEKFWMEDEGYIGMALDEHDRLVRSVSSDPCHCVLSGILDSEMARRVANRLMQPDLFSGWGIRTLSSKHPAYNPFAYHRGTVWPVENAGCVLGFARYGLHGEMWRLARSMFEAASLFEHDRLPETFGGHPRDQRHPFPGLYANADSPQAWSASAPITVMQALLGLYPYAPLDTLFLDPWLPDWLPEITLERLKVGKASVTLRFRRKQKGETDYHIEDLQGTLHVIRQPSPWSLTADWGERVKDAVMSLLPGK